MSPKLYVGNLSYGTTDDSLRAAFEQAGNVTSASVIIDKMNGRSRGFGFVEMATPEEAQAAIAMWNEKDLDGRPIRVNEAQERQDKPRTGGFGGGRPGGNRGGFGGGRPGNGGSRRYDN